MISTNRNTSNGEEVEEIELEPFLNPPASTETVNRPTASDEEAIGVVEDDIDGADIGRDERSGDEERGEAGTESVKNVSAPGDGVRCWIKSDMRDIYIPRSSAGTS